MTVRRLWPVLLVVPLGMLLGHQVVYEVLHAHGRAAPAVHAHGHLGLLAALASPLALVGLIGLVRAGYRDRRASAAGIIPTVLALAGAQSLAFAAMEVAERLAVGGELSELVRSPVLWIGAASQIAVAAGLWLGGRLVAGVACGLMLLIGAVRGTREAVTTAAPPPPAEWIPRLLPTLRWVLRRGPPVLLGP